MSVSVLELPYIFGRMPGRRPLWCPLVSYLRSPWPLFYTTGGTNMISVHRVAEAIAGAVVKGQHRKCYPIGGENRSWPELLVPFSKMAGRPKRVLTVPSLIVTMIMALVWVYHFIKRVESGLHPTAFVQLQTALTYFDPTPAQQALGFSGDGLKEALQETIDGCD
jgi:dihydroflavonol-4-reductase